MRPGPPRPPFRPRSPTSRQSTPRSRPPSPRRPSRAASWWRNILTKSWIMRVRGWPSQPVGLVGCVMLRVRRSVVGWVQQELERRIWSTTKRLSIGSNQKKFFRMVMALCSPSRSVQGRRGDERSGERSVRRMRSPAGADGLARSSPSQRPTVSLSSPIAMAKSSSSPSTIGYVAPSELVAGDLVRSGG